MGLLRIDEESPELNPSIVGIVLEGSLVMDDLASLPKAFCILFGLIYALHLDYPNSQVHEKYFLLCPAGNDQLG